VTTRNQLQDAAAARLAELRGAEQAGYALELLIASGRKETRRDTLRTALKVLARHPLPEARPALVQVFARHARNGGAHDYGCYVRGDVLRALRPIVTGAELPLLEQAATTYEFPPPRFAEEAGLLRSAALPALAEVDDRLARFHAARLLVDEYTERMSGEPAVTAARTLALLAEPLPLYQFVNDSAHRNRLEVIAECLRGLRTLPPTLLPPLLEALRQAPDARPGSGRQAEEPLPVAVRVGLIDLLLEHEAGPQQIDHLLEELHSGPPELVRYLLATCVAAAMTRGETTVLERCIDSLHHERRADRRALAAQALEPAEQLPAVAALLARWGTQSSR